MWEHKRTRVNRYLDQVETYLSCITTDMAAQDNDRRREERMSDRDRRQTIMYLYKKIRGTGEHSFTGSLEVDPIFP